MFVRVKKNRRTVGCARLHERHGNSDFPLMIGVKYTYRFGLLGGQRSKNLPADAFEVAFGSPLPSTRLEKVAAV